MVARRRPPAARGGRAGALERRDRSFRRGLLWELRRRGGGEQHGVLRGLL